MLVLEERPQILARGKDLEPSHIDQHAPTSTRSTSTPSRWKDHKEGHNTVWTPDLGAEGYRTYLFKHTICLSTCEPVSACHFPFGLMQTSYTPFLPRSLSPAPHSIPQGESRNERVPLCLTPTAIDVGN